MKNIVIRKLTLLNFKGIRNLEIDFSHNTNISGRNGCGKTTIFDAFTWLLFGKDSKDRKDFNIKTLDENNKAIERIPHEVTAVISVDGETIVLKKTYNEVWAKRRGASIETFNGHSVECFYNDVPCSVTEYSRKVADICDEQVFKLVTNPLFFCSQKKDFQRSMLFHLAGDISNEDIVALYPEFAELVNMLSGKTLEELKKEISAKKRKIKDGIDAIPARIDERKRDMPEERDWKRLEDENDILLGKIENIDEQITDRSKIYNEATKKRQEIARELSVVQAKITNRECELKNEILSEFYKKRHDRANLLTRAENLQTERRFKRLSLQTAEKELHDLTEQRESLLNEWRAIKEEALEFDAELFICPTCKRELSESDIEEKKEQLQSNFNAEKAKKLEINKYNGLSVKTALEAKQALIKSINDEIFRIEDEYARITNSPLYTESLIEPETDSAINSDQELSALRTTEKELLNELQSEVEIPDTGELTLERGKLSQMIMQNNILLNDKERIRANKKRISELESEYRESQCALAELEGIEYNIQQFSKAKIEQVEARINGLFTLVKFKMFEYQLNGGEVETCEAMVNGVPYCDLNSATRINAGLDIINAISKKQGITAPIFVDNRESVITLLPTYAQVINLSVSDNELTIS